jgi:hypothetical protein
VVQEIALLGFWRSGFFDHAAFYGGTALRSGAILSWPGRHPHPIPSADWRELIRHRRPHASSLCSG